MKRKWGEERGVGCCQGQELEFWALEVHCLLGMGTWLCIYLGRERLNPALGWKVVLHPFLSMWTPKRAGLSAAEVTHGGDSSSEPSLPALRDVWQQSLSYFLVGTTETGDICILFPHLVCHPLAQMWKIKVTPFPGMTNS
jgi:hypothetical protein